MAVLNKGIVGFSEYIKKDRLEPILVVIPFLEYREFSLDYERGPAVIRLLQVADWFGKK
jgi:hypothetical protein